MQAKLVDFLEGILTAVKAPAMGSPQLWAELVVVLLVALGAGRFLVLRAGKSRAGGFATSVALFLGLLAAGGAIGALVEFLPAAQQRAEWFPAALLGAGLLGWILVGGLALRGFGDVTFGTSAMILGLLAVLVIGAVVLERTLWTTVTETLGRVGASRAG